MPYFPVDDQMPFHPKIIAAGNAAVGVWTRAGAWSKGHATGGFVPTEIAHALGVREAKRLVSAGLWLVVDGGYQFHDWEHQAGNADAQTEKARRDRERERNRERQRAKRERDRNGVTRSVTNGGSAGPVTVSPSPSPSDVTHHSESSHEGDARDSTPDRIRNAHSKAAALGVKDLAAMRSLFVQAVGEPVSLAGAVELVVAVLSLAKSPVKDVDAYVATACRNSPAEVQRAYFDLDVEGVA